MPEIKNKKKKSSIIQISIGVLAVILAILIIIMMGIVSDIQGTARIVNYTGLVRGETQRIIKLEVAGEQDDAMIQEVRSFIDGLRNGNTKLNLVYLNDEDFQNKMQELDEGLKRCLAAGMTAHLAKPFQIEDVEKTIVECCGK